MYIYIYMYVCIYIYIYIDVRYVMPFVCTFGIALPTALNSVSACFVAISPTSPALGRLKRLVARVWFLNAKSVMR